MSSWFQALKSIIEDTIDQEDSEVFDSSSKKELTPLQSHIGILRKKPQPLFHTLPTELKLYIFSFISAEDLLSSVIYVCREWRKYVEDEYSWKLRFERDVLTWKAFGTSKLITLATQEDKSSQITITEVTEESNENLEDVKEEDSNSSSNIPLLLPNNCTWRQWYMIQYTQNHQPSNPEKALRKISSKTNSTPLKFNFISKLKKKDLKSLKYDKQRIFKIPIFGLALRNSARGLIYRLMWSQESPLTVNTLYPGVEGIGSGIGFRVNQKCLNVAAFYGDTTELKDWSQFFEIADGLIYVIDGKSTEAHFKKAVDQFKTFIPTNTAPILILSCYNTISTDNGNATDIYPPEDPDEEILGNPRALSEIAAQLELDKLTGIRHWSLRNANSLVDVCKGLDWLSSLL